MYVLKRIAASILDYVIVLVPAAFLLSRLDRSTSPHAPHEVFDLFNSAGLLGALAAPALVLGVMTGLFGCTPGKLLFFLRVHDHAGDPPGVGSGIVRELAKILLFATVYGLFYALASVLNDRQALYDQWLALEVEDLRPSGLTETQKKFRKFMREKERRERKGLR